MRVQTVVQHHPARADLLPRLLAALPKGATVVHDPGHDEPQRNPWRSYSHCLCQLADDATHLLIVQDDATCCLDFAKAVGLVVRRHPSVPIVLFTPGIGLQRRVILGACVDNKLYVRLPTANTFIPAVATIWPREAVASILAYVETRPPHASETADDGVLGRWAAATQAVILATVPSLVEHEDRERSLVGKQNYGGKNPARIAACWMGEDLSALTLDW